MSDKTAIRTSLFSIVSNALLAIIKTLGGYLGNSYALIADGIESATDVFSSFLVYLGIKYSLRPADENHPYGHGRVEPLITFIVVGFLIISAATIAYYSVINISAPHDKPEPWTLIILVIIIGWKEISYRIVIRKSRQTKSSALKADAWHHRSDAITSIAALIGISIALIMGEGYEMADDWAALLASGFILYNCYLIFRPALAEIMDEQLYDELIDEIRDVSLKVEGVLDTEKCFVRKVGMKYQVDLHAIVDSNISVKQGHDISHNLKDRLVKDIPNIGNVHIHIEPN
jgi:cation diffusion facilitator family transporter